MYSTPLLGHILCEKLSTAVPLWMWKITLGKFTVAWPTFDARRQVEQG